MNKALKLEKRVLKLIYLLCLLLFTNLALLQKPFDKKALSFTQNKNCPAKVAGTV